MRTNTVVGLDDDDNNNNGINVFSRVLLKIES